MSSYIVPIYDNKRWERLVRNAHRSDFHHTWYYHSSASPGDAVLLVYEEQSDYIALPLIRKYDAAGHLTAASYAGPVSTRLFTLNNSSLQQNFETALLRYLERERITRLSIRLHPLIHRDFQPVHTGLLQSHHDSLLLDLTSSPETYLQQFGGSFNNQVNLLRKKGFTVRRGIAISDVDKFADLYRYNMQRLNPDHYDKAWFRQMLRPAGFDSSLLLCCDGDEIAAGVLLTFCNDMMQLHLAATNENYLFNAPLRLLLAETALLGKSLGMQHLLLGGFADRAEVLFTGKVIGPDTYPGFRTWEVMQEVVQTETLGQSLSIAV